MMRPGVTIHGRILQPEVIAMIDLMGDTELDLLILPLVVTTLALGQTIDACVKWLKCHARLTSSLGRVPAEGQQLSLAA